MWPFLFDPFEYTFDQFQERSITNSLDVSTNLSASRPKADVPAEEASRAAAEQVALRSLDETRCPPLGRSELPSQHCAGFAYRQAGSLQGQPGRLFYPARLF